MRDNVPQRWTPNTTNGPSRFANRCFSICRSCDACLMSIFRVVISIGYDGVQSTVAAASSSSFAFAFASAASAFAFGPFYTSECRGGVERRQLALKGAEGGD